MTVNWGNYESFDPGVFGPMHALPRREARSAFARLMAAKAERIEALRGLLMRNRIHLQSTDASVQDVNDWFLQEVEPDPDKPGRMQPDWYPVINDLALFLGDVMIERSPSLRWEFYTYGKKNVSYQRPVIMGFTQTDPKYCIDPGLLFATYGHATVGGKEVEQDMFWRWIKSAESKA